MKDGRGCFGGIGLGGVGDHLLREIEPPHRAIDHGRGATHAARGAIRLQRGQRLAIAAQDRRGQRRLAVAAQPPRSAPRGTRAASAARRPAGSPPSRHPRPAAPAPRRSVRLPVARRGGGHQNLGPEAARSLGDPVVIRGDMDRVEGRDLAGRRASCVRSGSAPRRWPRAAWPAACPDSGSRHSARG